jgi:small subunit ribosomal protein S9
VNQTFNSTKGTGRRKSAVATVELVRGTGKLQSILSLVLIICNKKADLLFAIQAPLDLFQLKNQYDIGVNVMGGGFVGQADATLAIARALCKIDQAYRGSLKLKGY